MGNKIIAVGASLGGMHALARLLSALPRDLDGTVVSVLHRGEGSGEDLIRFLQSASVLPVREAEDKDELERGTVYVASTGDNEIFAIGNAAERSSSAGTGFMVFEDQNHLHGPLGLVLAPNGNLIAANGDAVNPGGTPNELVEFTTQGRLVAEYEMDAGAPGGAFGIASIVSQGSMRFASVDDNLNTVTIWNRGSQF
jgi:hypothetical protein